MDEKEKKKFSILVIVLSVVVAFIIGIIAARYVIKYNQVDKVALISRSVEKEYSEYQRIMKEQIQRVERQKIEYQESYVKSAILNIFSKIYYRDLKDLKFIDHDLIPKDSKILYILTKDGVTMEIGFFNERNIFETTIE